ncbi:MAG: asparagine synthase (glutamine-hydrolyzing) [Thermoleophilia bacterium]
MCGVAGWIGHVEIGERTIAAVVDSLKHRGPDGAGSRVFDRAGLIHTRLAIIDLSPLGDQPMANEDGTVWTVFNGELYNHHELRRDLERRGHRFAGASDTEVLPHLYEEHGMGMFERLRGMFAVAILDLKAGTVALGRDRFGIKPMFFTRGPEAVAFASEIRALRCFPNVDLTPDSQAISDYTGLYYIPAPRTLFRGIESLEPGHSVLLRRTATGVERTRSRFHQFAPVTDAAMNLQQAGDRADELVYQAVVRQLESDVPLGAMLSGGIDSSLVSAAAQAGLDGKLLSYNVRPATADLDETVYAREVAAHLGTHHTTVSMSEGAADWTTLTGFLRDLGQPLADPALFAVASVSRAMREHVTVALSGDGGDELFGGYRLFWKLGALSRLRTLPSSVLDLAGLGLRPLAAAGLVGSTMPGQLTSLSGLDDVAVVRSLYSSITDVDHFSLLSDPKAVEPIERLFERTWDMDDAGMSRIDRLSSHAIEAGVRLLLGSKFLFKSDMGSMRESLEIRVPLLDEDLADFALSLPHRLRVERRAGKRVLREVARRHVPESIAARPKHGFAVPFERWVDDAFRSSAREVLVDTASPLRDHLVREVYEPWVVAFSEGKQVPGITQKGLSDRVLMLVALEACLSA